MKDVTDAGLRGVTASSLIQFLARDGMNTGIAAAAMVSISYSPEYVERQ